MFSLMSAYPSNTSIKEKRLNVPLFNQILVSRPTTTPDGEDDLLKVSNLLFFFFLILFIYYSY